MSPPFSRAAYDRPLRIRKLQGPARGNLWPLPADACDILPLKGQNQSHFLPHDPPSRSPFVVHHSVREGLQCDRTEAAPFPQLKILPYGSRDTSHSHSSQCPTMFIRLGPALACREKWFEEPIQVSDTERYSHPRWLSSGSLVDQWSSWTPARLGPVSRRILARESKRAGAMPDQVSCRNLSLSPLLEPRH